ALLEVIDEALIGRDWSSGVEVDGAVRFGLGVKVVHGLCCGGRRDAESGERSKGHLNEATALPDHDAYPYGSELFEDYEDGSLEKGDPGLAHELVVEAFAVRLD